MSTNTEHVKEFFNDERKCILEQINAFKLLLKTEFDLEIPADNKREVIANVTLAFRHLEDARMRLGKAIQYCGDGISIFDKNEN